MSFDYTDLIRGEGEWRNLQEVVRRSFRHSFEQIERQQEQISQLVAIISQMKVQLGAKTTTCEVDSLIDTKIRLGPRAAPKEDVDDLKQELANLRADMERKAGIRYVDDALKRKLDKTDVLVKSLINFSGPQYSTEVNKLSGDVGEMKVKHEHMAKAINEICTTLRTTASNADVNGLHSQVEDLYSLAGTFETKQHFDEAMDNKVSSSQLANMLTAKTDKATLEQHLSSIQEVLTSHEKMLTAVRLREPTSHMSGPDGLTDDFTTDLFTNALSSHQQQQQFNHNNYTHGHTGYNNSSNNSNNSGSGPASVADVCLRVREGRVEAVVSSLWSKVAALDKHSHDQQVSHKSVLLRLDHCEGDIAAQQEKWQREQEAMTVLLEQQATRCDHILSGASAIEPVDRELSRQAAVLQGVTDYLQLDQQENNLSCQLSAVDKGLDLLRMRVGEASTAIGRAGDRLDLLEQTQVECEVRLTGAEELLADKVMPVVAAADFAHSGFADIKDVGTAVVALQQAAVQGKEDHLSLLHTQEQLDTVVTPRLSMLESRCADLDDSLSLLSDNVVGIYADIKKKSARRSASEEVRREDDDISRSVSAFRADQVQRALASAAAAGDNLDRSHINNKASSSTPPSVSRASCSSPLLSPQLSRSPAHGGNKSGNSFQAWDMNIHQHVHSAHDKLSHLMDRLSSPTRQRPAASHRDRSQYDLKQGSPVESDSAGSRRSSDELQENVPQNRQSSTTAGGERKDRQQSAHVLEKHSVAHTPQQHHLVAPLPSDKHTTASGQDRVRHSDSGVSYNHYYNQQQHQQHQYQSQPSRINHDMRSSTGSYSFASTTDRTPAGVGVDRGHIGGYTSSTMTATPRMTHPSSCAHYEHDNIALDIPQAQPVDRLSLLREEKLKLRRQLGHD